ncbi:hypothetical protein BJ994_002820 [Arthrobacter pigmenti]|uniref:Lipoprotein n=1 Tax=Arthrobacter pigmenti TaxID=271432 RepID=A0A846RTC3_9MICC|nr:hypothetical protein [Arthrobacter pigmenti]NJC23744.1 hypothetical protein [Arthrobacter pigmenti]
MRARATAAVLVTTAALALSGCGVLSANLGGEAEARDGAAVPADGCIGGWEGWWNSTPVDGNDEHLPQQTVTILTDTGRVIDTFDRSGNLAGDAETTGVDYQPEGDETWPANSAVVVDAETGETIKIIPIEPGTNVCGETP